jgi:formylglycine-generating enzyme required for sulfatase activity
VNHFSSSRLESGAAFVDFTRRAVGQPEDIAPQLVALPAGEFIMGENADDKFANDTERPAHRVTFPGPFALGIYPIRVGEFRCFCPAHAPDEPAAWPVACVNWQEATDYCNWLSEQSGRRFRLPSEAEWEYACRAGTSTPFALGDDITIADANFLYDETGRRIGPENRTPAGSYPPNAFGLHDLHGNVCEWVADSWHPNYLAAPHDGRAWIQPGDERRVIRGGAWDYLPRLLRSSWRDWRAESYRADNLGFRVATSDL